MNIVVTDAAPVRVAPTPVASRVEDFIAIRRELHADPELAFQEHRTGARVAGLLETWGYRVDRMAGTGVIATLENGPGPSLGIRADLDALPVTETTGLPWASRNEGVMHACGHDGHTAILLAAAHRLSIGRRFRGTLRLIFQPAEEIGAGARTLIAEGLFRDHPVDAVFGLHNWPGLPAGRYGFIEGPALAAVDRVDVRIQGKGAHGAEPHLGTDPVLVAAHAVTALQSIVSRNIDPLQTAVVTVGAIHGGRLSNVIPDTVDLNISLRSFAPDVRDRLRGRVPDLLHSIAAAFGATVDVAFLTGFPCVINSPAETRLIRDIAVAAFGANSVIADLPPRTASEDFSYYLQQRPGSFVLVGNGDSAPLHSPEYRFNDDIIAPSADLWVALAEAFLTGAADD